MLPLSQRVAFSIFTLLCLVFAARGFYRLYLRIRRGRRDTDRRTDHIARRIGYALRTTLLQERVFRKRPILSIFHSFIFYAFVLYTVVNLIDAVDGFYPLHSIAPAPVAAAYGGLTDLFSVLAILGMMAFVLRRFALRSRRDFAFNQFTLLDPKVNSGYVRRDSAIVAAFIIFHVGSRIVGNAAALALEGPKPLQPFSTALSHALATHDPLAWRIFGYWGALGSVLLFLIYFPYTKHIHILLAPVNYLLRRDAPTGELPSVKIDLEAAEPQLGASQLADLSWPRLLDAYACIQCNRCQDVCPASLTGKALSPAALEINKRMVLNSITAEDSAFALTSTAAFEQGASAGPNLLAAVMSPEAVWACTTCGACMHVCPTQDEQMLDIIDIRRNMVMLQGEFPSTLQTAFRGMERTSNPWGISRDKRMAWAEGLQVPTIDEVPNPDVLYWVGCAASYDPSAQKTARAVVQLLIQAKVRFAVLGKRECCTGDTARRAGNELLYQELANTAIETLQSATPALVLASCPHCVNTIAAEYPQLGGNFKVMHHTEYFAGMVQDGKLTPAHSGAKITFHDPCYLGRHRGTYDQPRSILKVLTNDYIELERNKSNSFCCGAGGAQFWKEEERGSERVSENRFKEAQRVLGSGPGEKVVAVGCPFCKSMLHSSPSAADNTQVVIKDVAELLWEGVQRANGYVSVIPNPEPQRIEATLPTYAAPLSHQDGSPCAAPESIQPPESLPAEPEPAGAMQPEPTESESPATPAPPRRKWSPKTMATGSSPAANLPSGTVQQAEAPTAPVVPEQPMSPVPEPAPTPQRKKWAPKSNSDTPASPAPEPSTAAGPEAPPTQPSTPEPNLPTVRKKWQPGGPR